MAIVNLPSNLALGPGGVRWGVRRFDVAGGNDATGNTQDRLGAPPRWALSLASPAGMVEADAVVWENLILQLRGRVNHLAAYDPSRMAPRGTMRGTMTLNASAAAGATSIQVLAATEANKTLLAGSGLTLGSGLGTSQLVRTVTDAQANGSGVITLTIEPPLRIAFSGGAAVAWDKPIAYFKTTTEASDWSYYRDQILTGFSLDLIERWA